MKQYQVLRPLIKANEEVKTFSLVPKNKSGKGGMSGGLSWALVAIIVLAFVVMLISAIGPTLFSNSTVAGAPSFFQTMWPLMISFSLLIVLLVIIMMMLKKVG